MAKIKKDTVSFTEAMIKEKYGDVIFNADKLFELEGKIIPTTLSLDIALSGGIAEGTITNLASPPKAGKTTLALTIIAQAQQVFKKECFYHDVEGRVRTALLECIPNLVWTEEQEKATGIPRLKIIKSSEDKFLSAQDYLNIIDQIFTKNKGCLQVLDSIAALCSDELHGTELGESKQMMKIPSLMYDFMRKIAQLIPSTKGTLITITHLQSNPTSYGNPLKSVGGNAIEYFASNRLVCYSSQEVPKDDNPKVGKDTKFKITAAALGAPSAEAMVYIRYGKGCDNEEDILTISEELGFIERAGAWYSFTHGDEKLKFQGRNAVLEHLKANPEHARTLEKNIRTTLLPERKHGKVGDLNEKDLQ